jgi:hypothetical protein
MNRKSARTIVWVSVGALALIGLMLVVTSAWAGPARVNPTAPLAPADVVSGTLSYQGQLLSGGSPVNGTRVMTFSVYAQSSGGAPLWSQVIDVVVTKGLFTVYLQVDPMLFNGQALWLGVTVAGESEMTPRQSLLPAPYALSLRPGATVSGTLSDPILRVINQGSGHAIWAGADITYPTIYGENMGVGPALLGYSANGTGVSGQGTDGVRGTGLGMTSTGVFGEGMIGVRGQSEGGVGVSGSSTNNFAVYGEDIFGTAGFFTSTNGAGVWANSINGHAIKTKRPSLIAGPNPKQVALLRWYPAIATTTTWGVGANPDGVAFDGANIWVANWGGGTVSVLRANDGYKVMTPTVGSAPMELAYDGANMWVANNGGNSVSVLRASDGNSVMTPTVGDCPVGVAFDGINMWVANSESANVSVLRASDGAHVITPTVGHAPEYIAFDGTNMWIVNNNDDNVSVLRLDSGPSITRVMTPTVESSPHGIAFDGANMWVVNTLSNTVSVLRGSDGALLATIPMGNAPAHIAFDGANMWVVNGNDNMVTIVRAADFAVMGIVPVGSQPGGIAFDGANMWVANNGDGTVSKR